MSPSDSCRDLGGEQIAAARDDLDDFLLVVAERGADLADALVKAVLADIDVRPHRGDDGVLAENLAGMGREQLQQLERLPAKLEDLPGRAAELRTPLVKLEAGKFEGPCPAHGIVRFR